MTVPIRPTPKSLDGRSARELFGIERTTTDGGPTNPPAVGGTVPPVITVPFQNGGDVHRFPALASGDIDPLWPIVRYDARGANQIRVVTNVKAIGAAAAQLVGTYSDGGPFVTPGITGVDVAASIGALGARPLANQGWVDLDPAAINDRLWQLVLRGGDGVASPALWGSHLQFRLKATSAPPRGGGPWGNLVWEINALGTAMAALAYADGADANLFPDETGLGGDMATAAVLLVPTYLAAGFPGGLPCVAWAGGNVPLTTPDNPTVDYGSYTYYFVASDLDGGDGARLWGAGFFDSFQYSFYFYDAQISAANNNLFGAPSITALDDWGMATKHIYRFVKNAGSSTHSIYVDGVLKGSATAAPQTNNGGLAQLMYDLGGVGCSGKIAYGGAYDQPHEAPVPNGLVANGLTGPELALQATWGTP